MLNQFSNQLADAVASAAPSVVQVNGGRRPVSGLVYADDVVLTTMRGVGRNEHVPRAARRRAGSSRGIGRLGSGDAARGAARARPGRAADRARGGGAARRASRPRDRPLVEQRRRPPRPGSCRSSADRWPTGRRRSIDRVIRTSAPMHEGFSGGAFLDTARRAPRRGDGHRDPRPGRRDSGRHRVDGGGDAAGARQPEARISWDRGAAGERPR